MSLLPEPASAADPDIAALLEEYGAEVLRRSLDPVDPGRVTATDEAEFRPPAGRFLVIRDGDGLAGCGGIRLIATGVGELKRMYIRPSYRGRGLGRTLLVALEAAGRELGCTTLRLDTRSELDEARGLYAAAGYREVSAYNANPDAQHWFEKTLG